MKGMTVAVLGDSALAARLGKKGTVTDMTFYNLKKGTTGITYIEPSRYPEKLQSLACALGMADAVVLSIEKIDKTIGEMIVAIDSFGIERGYIILKSFLQKDQLAPFVKGTILEKFEYIDDDFNKINDMFVGMELPPVDGPVKVPIDQAFNVKGVGAVALGCVRKGILKQHDTLEAFPTGKKAMVRSIQVHDEDVPEAGFGNRVGLALKGIEADELGRGVVFAPTGSLKMSGSLELALNVSKFWKGVIVKGMVLHAACGLQIVPVLVEEVAGDGIRTGTTGKVVLRSDKPLAFTPGDRLVILDLDGKGLRILAWGVLQ
jgi:selenocysteine-specific translation elongation factor